MESKKESPPRLFLRFFRWYCHPRMRDYIEGDLKEVYQQRIRAVGKYKADIRFMIDVMLLFRPGIIKPAEGYKKLNTFGMYKNYFKIGFRNLVKSKLFSLINISGMAISMASVILIGLFIYDELQFDKHVEDYSRKYRLYTETRTTDGSLRKQAMVAPMIAPTAMNEFPEVESYARILYLRNPILFQTSDKKLTEQGGGYADASILSMFSLRILEGNASTALQAPGAIAISETLKKKYFDDKPGLGEIIEIDNQNYKITAVFEDFSAHSHLQLKFFFPMAEFAIAQPKRMERWTWNQFHTYVKLKEGTDPVQLEGKLAGMITRNIDDDRDRPTPRLMALNDIHLQAYDHLWDIAVKGNIQTIYILFATAGFILIISILNFINLSTARSVNRVREVGVRKVIGAFRSHLINQFITESVVVALIALAVGCAVALFILPYLNEFTEKNIPLRWFIDPKAIFSLVVLGLMIGIAAGTYPAFYISSQKTIQALSGKGSTAASKAFLRKGMVVFQFMLSFFLIIAAFIVSDQHRFMRSANMGFDKDNLLVLELRGDMTRNLETTRQEFLNHPNIISASIGYGLPGEAFAGDGIIDKVTGKEVGMSMLTVDHDYIRTLGLEIVAGRDFSRNIPSDEKHAFILSERAAQLLGYVDPHDALEHEVSWNRWDASDSLKEGKVIGIIKDMQLNSMRETINPIVLHVYPFAYSNLTLKVKPDDLPATLAHLEETWKKFNTEWPFAYRFLDENFERMYKSEERLATLFAWFTTFTIFVACLGLFGLVVYSTSQKYKEISIRKVLGAGETSLIVQLGKTYVALIVIAFIIVIPFSYYATNDWLQKFAFRISITPLYFVKAAVLISLISLLTVGLQAYKAAHTNPVNALKEQ